MTFQYFQRKVFGLVLLLGIIFGSSVLAEDEPTEWPGVMERIGNTAKKVGGKIEQGFDKAARKLEGKKVGEKLERKLKKSCEQNRGRVQEGRRQD